METFLITIKQYSKQGFFCGYNDYSTHQMLVSFCTPCEVRLECNQSFLPRECVCKKLRSHETCAFCYTLQYKFNILL